MTAWALLTPPLLLLLMVLLGRLEAKLEEQTPPPPPKPRRHRRRSLRAAPAAGAGQVEPVSRPALLTRRRRPGRQGRRTALPSAEPMTAVLRGFRRTGVRPSKLHGRTAAQLKDGSER